MVFINFEPFAHVNPLDTRCFSQKYRLVDTAIFESLPCFCYLYKIPHNWSSNKGFNY